MVQSLQNRLARSIAFHFATLVLLLTGCTNDPQEIKKLSERKNYPLHTAQDIVMMYSDSALLKIRLTAPQVDEYAGNNPYTEMKKGMKVEFFNDSMTVNTSITSNYAVRRERERTMEARNRVIVTNAKGERLETEQLTWDENRQLIHTKAHVKVTQNGQIVHSEGLEADETFTTYKFTKVTGIFAIPDGTTPKE